MNSRRPGIEFSRRIAASVTVFALGSLTLNACASEYEGWSGCAQAEFKPKAPTVHRAIVADIKQSNEDATQLNNGSISWEDGTTKSFLDALEQIYEQAYGSNQTNFQVHDEIPYCLSEDGEITIDLGGEFVANDIQFEHEDNLWRPTTN